MEYVINEKSGVRNQKVEYVINAKSGARNQRVEYVLKKRWRYMGYIGYEVHGV